MPTIFYRYACNQCGRTFDTEHEARNCEDCHLEARSTNYIYDASRPSYPVVISVVFKDGTKLEYAVVE